MGWNGMDPMMDDGKEEEGEEEGGEEKERLETEQG